MAYLGIMRLQRAYADIATRNAWDEVPSIATPDARFSFDTRAGRVFEVDGPAEFGAFGAQANERFSFYEYIPLNFVVEIDGVDTAHGRSYSLEVALDRASGDWNEFYGTYQDEYALFEGTWRFSRRRYSTYGRRTEGRLESFPLQLPPL